jgi:dipeptide/tripeptide permease
MRAVLVLFLTNQLDFGDDSATALYHAFIMLCYLLPLLGAIISDSCLGKYGTILGLSMVYAVGNIIVSVSAIPFDGPKGAKGANIALAAVGLAVIALGTGGIKPCVSAFGGDQFNKEGQEKSRRYFFSLFYFSINAGSVISTLLTPILRDDIDCFNTGECFALAFGVPAVLMIVSLVIFVVGTKFYVIVKPKKESARLFLDIPASIVSAVGRRIKHGRISDKKHWLQYASPKYTNTFIEDVRLLLRVLLMFLPLPIFWAPFDQQGSRWTLQAVRMNGQLGSISIKPDQMQALNPILILVCIPLFEIIVYPIAAKVHLLQKPLQRMVVGMFIAGLAFMVAGFVQISVQKADTSLSSGDAKVVVINSSPDTLYMNISGESLNLTSAESFQYNTRDLYSNQTLCVSANLSTDDLCADTTYNFSLTSKHILQLVLSLDINEELIVTEIDDKEKLPDGGKSSFRVINTIASASYVNFTLYSKKCDCSQEECGHLKFSADMTFLNVSEAEEVDFDQ